jgi:hypothetical protein
MEDYPARRRNRIWFAYPIEKEARATGIDVQVLLEEKGNRHSEADEHKQFALLTS